MRLLANKMMLSRVTNRSRDRWGQNRERISRERLSLLSLSLSSMQLEDELLALGLQDLGPGLAESLRLLYSFIPALTVCSGPVAQRHIYNE
jgi:hypothetical protein